MVQELIKRTGTKADIKVAAWEDGYKAVMNKPNTALFSMAMTPERKPMLQWVGPIIIQDTNLYAKKGANIGIVRLEDAKKASKIVVVKDYSSEEQLKKAGFTNLETVVTEETAIKKLLTGEAELFPSGNITMPSLLKNAGATINDVEMVLNLSTNMSYITFSKGTSPKLVARWQKTLDEMKTTEPSGGSTQNGCPPRQPPEIIQMMTEEYPPVTFMKNGKVTGFVTEIVREISDRQGIPDNIRLTSWDEAYNLGADQSECGALQCRENGKAGKAVSMGRAGRQKQLYLLRQEGFRHQNEQSGRCQKGSRHRHDSQLV